MYPELSDWLIGAAAKLLSEVEINPHRSHQHEFQGTALVRGFLGDTSDRRSMPARFVYLEDDVTPILVEDAWVTYYDSRANQPHRSSEYRIYYPDNDVIRAGVAGDLFIFAALRDGSALVVIARAGSTYASQALYLLGVSAPTSSFTIAEQSSLDAELTPVNAEVLLDLFGIDAAFDDTAEFEAAILGFGSGFPGTAAVSSAARELVTGADPIGDPDGTLLTWWETEYRLFRALERRVVEGRLAEGFHGATAVEDFLSFSLSVQNRRKSRSGQAFENHLAALFNVHRLRYERGAVTERNARPDFLFPSRRAYFDISFPADRLRMLGAKTTAKDRWRQVLTEADRVRSKHLITLEPAISERQTDEMRSLGVQLVVPRGIQATYTPSQRAWIWSLQDFIEDAMSGTHAGVDAGRPDSALELDIEQGSLREGRVGGQTAN